MTIQIDLSQITPSADGKYYEAFPAGDAPLSTYTITGSGFGTKSTAAPIKFDKFNTYTDGTTLQSNDAAWQEYQTNGGSLIQSDRPRHVGSKHVYNDSTRHGFATNYHTFTATNEVFLSYWFSTDLATYGAGGTYWVGKHSRISSSPASGGGGVYNGLGVHALSNQNPQAESNPYLYQYNGTNTLGEVIDYITVPQSNTWYRIDMYAKLSTIDASDGIFNCHTWGYENYTNSTIPSLVTGNSYQLDSVILGTMFSNHADAFGGIKITDVYIDNTRQRVELTDSATYSSSTWAEVQPATAWSDTSITIQLNTAGRTGTAYLHVLDSSGASVYSEEITL